MILYSTILNIKSCLAKKSFIDLIIEWNNNNPHEVNRIRGITWNGEQNIRFGDEKLGAEWYLRAAENGHPTAVSVLREMGLYS